MLGAKSISLFGQANTSISCCKRGIGIMYNSHFGFLESPFSVTPDPRFFYTNPTYLEVDASLRYGIEAKKGFIVVTGEVGTGKTTLLRKLLRNFGTTVQSVFIFNTYLSFPELLQVTLHDLGLPYKNATRVTMLQELNDYLIQQLKQGHTVAMLIDEAQHLSDEALENLRLLSNLETDQEKLLQIVLMGQPEFEVKLDQPELRQLKQRVTVQCRLGPLKHEEVNEYIEFRLRTAGYQGAGLFDSEAVQQIAIYSKGIPRLINIICDSALLTAYAESRKIVSVDIIKQVARDFRIGSDARLAASTPALLVDTTTERQTFIRKLLNKVHEHTASGFVTAAIGTVLGILLFVVAATVIGPHSQRISMAGKGLEGVGHNQQIPKQANAKIELKPEVQRVIVRDGATIYKIAAEVYGAHTSLGMDLIKEFNPHISNLNWVFAGQDLILPALTLETLLRHQPDGSYDLIVASFRSRAAANEHARLLSKNGYLVTITTRSVSDDLVLHRVEIDGLKNLDEVKQIWQTGLKNQWLAFADKASATR
jgi:general secretion pathway protein A